MSRGWRWFWLLLYLGMLALDLYLGFTIAACIAAASAGFWVGSWIYGEH